MNLHVASFVLLAAAIPALPAGCGGGLKLNVDQCKTYQAAFQGDPAGAEQTLSKSFQVDTAELTAEAEKQGAKDVTVKLNTVTFTADTGVSDFSFVESGDLSVLGDAGAAAPLVSYAAPAAGNANPLVFDAGGADLTSYLSNTSLHVQAELKGKAPTVDWSASVKVCFKIGGTLGGSSSSSGTDAGTSK